MAIKASGGGGMVQGERPEQQGVVHEHNPSCRQLQPQDNTAGSFIMSSSSHLPKAQRMKARDGQVYLVLLSLRCSPDCEVFNK